MAVASFGLTICLVVSAVNLITAKRPRWAFLTATYSAAWLYDTVVSILPELLSDSIRLSFARAMGVANTAMAPVQILHVPMIGAALCGIATYLFSEFSNGRLVPETCTNGVRMGYKK
jgi:hypothetical protein